MHRGTQGPPPPRDTAGKDTPRDERAVTRRTALGYAASAAAAAALTACDPVPFAPDREYQPLESVPFRAFMFIHDASVQIVIAEHDDIDKFTMIVRKSGREVERYEGLNDKTVGDIKSDLVRVAYINAPS